MQTESKAKPEWENDIPSVPERALDKPEWEDDIPLEEHQAAKVEVDAIGTTAPDDPYEVRTEHSFATHPVSKGIVVLGLTFMALSVLGLFFKIFTGGFSTSGNAVANKPEAPSQPVHQSITEADTLRAKLLLTEQNKELSDFRQKKQAKLASQPKPQPVAVPPTPIAVAPRPTPVYSPPRPRSSYSRPVDYSPPPPPPRVYPTVRNFAPPQRVLQPIIPPPPPSIPQVDPSQQWLEAANMGSYGSMPVTQKSSVASARGANYRNVSSERLEEIRTDKISQDDPMRAQYQSANYPLSSSSSVVVGTKVKAKLETPIAWSGSLQNPNQNFLIQLDEPLKTAQNTIAIPKGAYLVAKISAANQVGLLSMSVTSVLVNENGLTSEKPIPNGVLLILGKDGQPLKASSQRRNTNGNDLGTVVLSGVASTASLINRPTSQSVYNSDGGFSSTTTTNDPNYLAGFGQGASQQLLQQMQTRNNQSRQAALSEPKVFTLKQGTSLQVFVNQSTSF